jgi:hypothetical protein
MSCAVVHPLLSPPFDLQVNDNNWSNPPINHSHCSNVHKRSPIWRRSLENHRICIHNSRQAASCRWIGGTHFRRSYWTSTVSATHLQRSPSKTFQLMPLSWISCTDGSMFLVKVDLSTNQRHPFLGNLAIGRDAREDMQHTFQFSVWCDSFQLMRSSVTSNKHPGSWKHLHLQMRSTAMSVGAAWFCVMGAYSAERYFVLW